MNMTKTSKNEKEKKRMAKKRQKKLQKRVKRFTSKVERTVSFFAVFLCIVMVTLETLDARKQGKEKAVQTAE